MTRQKSERRTVPKGRRKPVPTRDASHEGGRAAPVNERTWQLGLHFETAEELAARAASADAGTDTGRPVPAPCAVPKSKRNEKTTMSATMEEVCERLELAFQNVAANRGAPGPDRQSIKQVREHLSELLPALREALLKDTYAPGTIRRVWIPKAGGEQRGLGIPNVVDRVVQEAVRLVLEPLYEPTFHAASHGFRPDRSCQTAIAAAYEHVDEGYEWVVDIDLEKFFDKVNHQRLMARLAQRIGDRRLLVLIGRMLKAKVVMPDGMVSSNDEGVPQGSPLSPLLSNIVLDELDRELSRRGYHFVRYADDCNVYVRSERAGRRVMASVTDFIERRLRLKVNRQKSAVSRPEDRHFLGFRLRREPLDGSVEVLLSGRSKERLYAKIRELTPRTWGSSLAACIRSVNVYLQGWVSFFAICTAGAERVLGNADAHIRRRLRAIQVKHWKAKRTIARRLIQLGVTRKLAWRSTYAGRTSTWAASHTAAVERGLRNAYFAERGLVSLAAEWKRRGKSIGAPASQLELALGSKRS